MAFVVYVFAVVSSFITMLILMFFRTGWLKLTFVLNSIEIYLYQCFLLPNSQWLFAICLSLTYIDLWWLFWKVTKKGQFYLITCVYHNLTIISVAIVICLRVDWLKGTALLNYMRVSLSDNFCNHSDFFTCRVTERAQLC